MRLISSDGDRVYWGRVIALALVVMAALGLLSAGIWYIGVRTSNVHGRGEQTKQINTAENRTFAQEHFHQLYQDILGYDRQVDVQAAALRLHPLRDAEHDRLAAVLSGLKNQCIQTSQTYNAEASKISQRRFRDADLPDHIDAQNPATDCKEKAA